MQLLKSMGSNYINCLVQQVPVPWGTATEFTVIAIVLLLYGFSSASRGKILALYLEIALENDDFKRQGRNVFKHEMENQNYFKNLKIISTGLNTS